MVNTDQWREDVRFFASAVQQHHKNAFHFVSKQQFADAVAALDACIPALKDYEIVVGLQRLAAMIGDGHTFLATWDLHHVYPLDMYWFEDDLRVIRTVAPYQAALGTRLVAIDGVPIAEINTRVQSVIPQRENAWYVLQHSVQQMMRAEVLASLGIVPNVEQATFMFEDDRGRQFTRDIAPVTPHAQLDWMSAAKNLPWYQQRPRDPFWFVELPDLHILYVNFRGYSRLEQHARRLWALVDRHMPKRLVIDMRQNGGGNYTLARSHLIYEVQQRPWLNSTGCLFVIIGRGTFSAAMTTATDFRRETDAILVGEPTGARPKGYQENHWLTLPNSELQVSVASRYYKFQDAPTPAVMPDQFVELNWSDYQAGHDAVLAWIVSHDAL
jgi:hypothetical protein